MLDTERRSPYGATVWVALAWLCFAATAAITFLALRLSMQACVKWCLSFAEALVLSVGVVLPFLLAALATVFALTTVTRRRLSSANLAGFVTALIAIPLSAGLIFLLVTIFL